MRLSGLWGLAFAIVVAVAIADLVANPKGTQVLTKSAVRAETVALNAELGRPS